MDNKIKYGFVYQWTNLITGQKYIGRHSGLTTDNYVGSGKYFRNALNKYGIINFSREILGYANTLVELKILEKFYLDLFNAAKNKNYYNISPNSHGGHHGADHTGSNNPMYGKKHPNHVPHIGSDNGMFGIHRSLEKNPNAKKFLIINPNKEQILVTCLKKWVIENVEEKLVKSHYQSIKNLSYLSGPGKQGFYKHWEVRLIKEENVINIQSKQ